MERPESQPDGLDGLFDALRSPGTDLELDCSGAVVDSFATAMQQPALVELRDRRRSGGRARLTRVVGISVASVASLATAAAAANLAGPALLPSNDTQTAVSAPSNHSTSPIGASTAPQIAAPGASTTTPPVHSSTIVSEVPSPPADSGLETGKTSGAAIPTGSVVSTTPGVGGLCKAFTDAVARGDHTGGSRTEARLESAAVSAGVSVGELCAGQPVSPAVTTPATAPNAPPNATAPTTAPPTTTPASTSTTQPKPPSTTTSPPTTTAPNEDGGNGTPSNTAPGQSKDRANKGNGNK